MDTPLACGWWIQNPADALHRSTIVQRLTDTPRVGRTWSSLVRRWPADGGQAFGMSTLQNPADAPHRSVIVQRLTDTPPVGRTWRSLVRRWPADGGQAFGMFTLQNPADAHTASVAWISPGAIRKICST